MLKSKRIQDFPSIDVVKQYKKHEIEQVLNKLLKANEFLYEEVAACESYLSRNIHANAPKTLTVEKITDTSSEASAKNSVKSSTNNMKQKKKKSRTNILPVYELSLEHKIELVANEIEELRSRIDKEAKSFENELELIRV